MNLLEFLNLNGQGVLLSLISSAFYGAVIFGLKKYIKLKFGLIIAILIITVLIGSAFYTLRLEKKSFGENYTFRILEREENGSLFLKANAKFHELPNHLISGNIKVKPKLNYTPLFGSDSDIEKLDIRQICQLNFQKEMDEFNQELWSIFPSPKSGKLVRLMPDNVIFTPTDKIRKIKDKKPYTLKINDLVELSDIAIYNKDSLLLLCEDGLIFISKKPLSNLYDSVPSILIKEKFDIKIALSKYIEEYKLEINKESIELGWQSFNYTGVADYYIAANNNSQIIVLLKIDDKIKITKITSIQNNLLWMEDAIELKNDFLVIDGPVGIIETINASGIRIKSNDELTENLEVTFLQGITKIEDKLYAFDHFGNIFYKGTKKWKKLYEHKKQNESIQGIEFDPYLNGIWVASETYFKFIKPDLFTNHYLVFKNMSDIKVILGIILLFALVFALVGNKNLHIKN